MILVLLTSYIVTLKALVERFYIFVTQEGRDLIALLDDRVSMGDKDLTFPVDRNLNTFFRQASGDILYAITDDRLTCR